MAERKGKALKHFTTTLSEYGKNDQERSSVLKIPPRTLTRYRNGKFPPVIRKLMEHPKLLVALARDALARDALANK
jgi:hypothetical protein